MTEEFETGALAALGGVTRAAGSPPGEPAPCPNCGEMATGDYCSYCGQLQKEFNRPLFSLIKHGLQDTFALDGRLMRTLPYLFLRPGRMTREYLDGKRARFVPPFRLFLLASLVFFLTLFAFVKVEEDFTARPAPPSAAAAGVEEQEGKSQPADDNSVGLSEYLLLPDGRVDRDRLEAMVRERTSLEPVVTDRLVDFANRIATAYENETLYMTVVQSWAPRISFFQLPVFALLLGLLYVWRRKYVLYDHIITSLHLQAFFYLLSTVLLLVTPFIGASVLFFLLLVPPAYIYRQLRVTYADGRIMAVLRTTFLCVASLVIIILLLFALMLTGLYQL